MKRLTYALPLLAATVGLIMAKTPTLTPAESESKIEVYEGEVPEGTDITILVYANGLISEALSDPEHINPVELGVAALMYFAMANTVPDPDTPGAKRMRNYAMSLLKQAISVAETSENPKSGYTLLWLSAILGTKYVGGGYDSSNVDLAASIKQTGLDRIKLMSEPAFMGGGGAAPFEWWLVPQDYYEE